MNLTRREFAASFLILPTALRGVFRQRSGQEGIKLPITSPNSPFNRAFEFSSLASWITPNSEFFIRSHFGVPETSRAWTIKVRGSVERELAITLDAVNRLPARNIPVTLECAGNLVGWGGVSNARWTGVSLAAILNQAGVLPGSEQVVLVGSDGGSEREAGGINVDSFARAIPLAKALEPSTILATGMNGLPLPAEHGGPVRAIVPGYYGMDSVKWVKEIFVSREPFRGFYQTSRYYEARRVNGRQVTEDLHRMKIKSQIARPARGAAIAAGPVVVMGAAWSGESQIRSVKVSVDGGVTWKTAPLGTEDEPSAWRLWSLDWQASPGRYELVARAADARGDEQPMDRDPSIITPYANNWADRRIVEVR
jgi:DMSO/TMAO reductase YedYZ molybdopterin-dependent catalytic subunit